MPLVKDYDDDSREIDTEKCTFCVGNSAVRKAGGVLMTSKEWCEEVKTCAATIDWDKVFHRSL